MAFMPCYAKLEGKTYDFPGLQWYHDAVTWCITSGVLPGLDIDDTFGIVQSASRADLAYALWMLAGAPGQEAPAAGETPEATPAPTPAPTPYPYGDVPEESAARTAIAWTVEQGLMTAENGAFKPGGAVSGEAAAQALAALAGSQGFAADDALAELRSLGAGSATREALATALYLWNGLASGAVG